MLMGSVLVLRPQPEVPEVHEEGRAVLLRGNRVVLRQVHDLERFDAQFHPSRRPLLGAHGAGDADGRLLGHHFGGLPGLLGDLFPEDDALQITAPVPDDRSG